MTKKITEEFLFQQGSMIRNDRTKYNQESVRIIGKINARQELKPRLQLSFAFVKKFSVQSQCPAHFSFHKQDVVYMMLNSKVTSVEPFYFRRNNKKSQPALISFKHLSFQICEHLKLPWLDSKNPYINYVLHHQIVSELGEIPQIFELKKMIKIKPKGDL